jgi:hypothetical protein
VPGLGRAAASTAMPVTVSMPLTPNVLAVRLTLRANFILKNYCKFLPRRRLSAFWLQYIYHIIRFVDPGDLQVDLQFAKSLCATH